MFSVRRKLHLTEKRLALRATVAAEHLLNQRTVQVRREHFDEVVHIRPHIGAVASPNHGGAVWEDRRDINPDQTMVSRGVVRNL